MIVKCSKDRRALSLFFVKMQLNVFELTFSTDYFFTNFGVFLDCSVARKFILAKVNFGPERSRKFGFKIISIKFFFNGRTAAEGLNSPVPFLRKFIPAKVHTNKIVFEKR